MLIISPSILAADFSMLGEVVRRAGYVSCNDS